VLDDGITYSKDLSRAQDQEEVLEDCEW